MSSYHVMPPSGVCSTIAEAHWKSLSRRVFSVSEMLRLTNAKTTPAYTASTTTIAATYHTVSRTRTRSDPNQRPLPAPRQQGPHGPDPNDQAFPLLLRRSWAPAALRPGAG